MYKILLLICFLSVTDTYAQLKPAILKLKTGEQFSVVGKFKSNNYFKYKNDIYGKSNKIHFSEIEFVQMKNETDKMSVFKYFNVKGWEEGIVVEEVELGNKASLYAIIRNVFVKQAGFTTTIVSENFFAKKAGENELTHLGKYAPMLNNLREKILSFYGDCEGLVTKIEEREFKVRSDVIEITRYYNDHCK